MRMLYKQLFVNFVLVTILVGLASSYPPEENLIHKRQDATSTS
ncbi:13366_t:CDS:1, partial [Acaulospora morrowiae]